MTDSEVSKYRLLFIIASFEAAGVGGDWDEIPPYELRKQVREVLEGMSPEEVKASVETMMSPVDIAGGYDDVDMMTRLAA